MLLRINIPNIQKLVFVLLLPCKDGKIQFSFISNLAEMSNSISPSRNKTRIILVQILTLCERLTM